MTDILTIDTGAGIVTEERVEPLPLYDDKLPALKVAIPEYTDSLPNKNMTELTKRLKMTMKKFGGIGLSANQCGILQRVFIIGTDHFQITCINPKIVAHSEEMVKDKEGCLSYPGMYLNIPRYSWIEAEFTTETGEVKRMRFEGITARCYQHELDHMNGVRYTDHVGQTSIMLAKQKQAKMLKQMQRKTKNKNAVLF